MEIEASGDLEHCIIYEIHGPKINSVSLFQDSSYSLYVLRHGPLYSGLEPGLGKWWTYRNRKGEKLP